jgi:hypothetical protein
MYIKLMLPMTKIKNSILLLLWEKEMKINAGLCCQFFLSAMDLGEPVLTKILLNKYCCLLPLL